MGENLSMSDKQALRRHFLEVRRALRPEQVNAAGEEIALRVTGLDALQQSPAMLCYVDSKDNEAPTRGLLRWGLAAGKTVLVPVGLPGRALGWSVLTDPDGLERTAFGIWEPPEPARELVLAPGDVPVLVPGIAFDENGYRLGYGGGYYDRFLAHHTGLKIGLAYDCQLIEKLPYKPHDVPVDTIVTESRIRRCDPATPKNEEV